MSAKHDLLGQAIRRLIANDVEPTVDLQDAYRDLHAWALRGMGYGLGDHPSTSGERHVLDYCGQHVNAGPMIFDVGANVGEWSNMALRYFPANSKYVHAFEPSGAAAVKIPQFPGYLTVHAFGMSDYEHPVTLYTEAPGSGMASVYNRRLSHFGRELGITEGVRMRRLDDVCADLHIPRIDLLKLDVEGHELAVLRGAGDTLTSGAIRMIQWEMGGCNLDARTTFQDFWYLLHERYDIYRVVADGLAPVTRYREQDEVYICANFCAVWRD
jgi:FkbM family methyltransferase